jgi:hypothetical protein
MIDKPTLTIREISSKRFLYEVGSMSNSLDISLCLSHIKANNPNIIWICGVIFNDAHSLCDKVRNILPNFIFSEEVVNNRLIIRLTRNDYEVCDIMDILSKSDDLGNNTPEDKLLREIDVYIMNNVKKFAEKIVDEKIQLLD